MDIVYFGSGAFGLPTLRAIAATHNLCAIVTQPDKPAGRGGGLTPTPVGEYAAAELPLVPLYKPQKVNEASVVEPIRQHGGEGQTAWVVIAFGKKLGQKLLADRFAVNLHASLLPRWRGAAPINAAILGGDAFTGNSIITLAEQMDAGLILGQSHREILPHITAGELHDQLASDGPPLMLDVLARHATGRLASTVQDEACVTLAGKFSKADGWVGFSSNADECRRRVHGLTPWPGVTVRFRGQPMKLLRVAVAQGAPLSNAGAHAGPEAHLGEGTPRNILEGSLVDAAVGLVRCGEQTALQLVTVQPAGGKAMPWADFARGRQPKRFEIVESGPQIGE